MKQLPDSLPQSNFDAVVNEEHKQGNHSKPKITGRFGAAIHSTQPLLPPSAAKGLCPGTQFPQQKNKDMKDLNHAALQEKHNGGMSKAMLTWLALAHKHSQPPESLSKSQEAWEVFLQVTADTNQARCMAGWKN